MKNYKSEPISDCLSILLIGIAIGALGVLFWELVAYVIMKVVGSM